MNLNNKQFTNRHILTLFNEIIIVNRNALNIILKPFYPYLKMVSYFILDNRIRRRTETIDYKMNGTDEQYQVDQGTKLPDQGLVTLYLNKLALFIFKHVKTWVIITKQTPIQWYFSIFSCYFNTVNSQLSMDRSSALQFILSCQTGLN